MHLTDSQAALFAAVGFIVLQRVELWRERRRTSDYRNALNKSLDAMKILAKGDSKDG